MNGLNLPSLYQIQYIFIKGLTIVGTVHYCYKSHLHQTRGFSRVLCVKTRVERRMPIPEGDLEGAFATLPGHNLVRLWPVTYYSISTVSISTGWNEKDWQIKGRILHCYRHIMSHIFCIFAELYKEQTNRETGMYIRRFCTNPRQSVSSNHSSYGR